MPGTSSAAAPGLGGARRILVYGVTGAGKTVAAERIGSLTGIAWTEGDALCWEPGWVLVDEAEQRRRLREVCDRDEWVLDTAWGSWLDIALSRAQLVVALDYPRLVSLRRLVVRTAARIRDRREICNGNVETLRGALSRSSILAFHVRSFARKRALVRRWAATGVPGGARLLVMARPRDLDAWLSTLRGPAAP